MIIATNLNLFHINHEFVFFPMLYQHLHIKISSNITFHSFWIKILKERRKEAHSVILNSSIKSKWIHFHFFFLFMYPCHWWKKTQYRCLLFYLSSKNYFFHCYKTSHIILLTQDSIMSEQHWLVKLRFSCPATLLCRKKYLNGHFLLSPESFPNLSESPFP